MAHYMLTDNFIQLPLTKGIVENISGYDAEIAVTPTAGTGYILYPHRKLAFNTTVYAARAPGEVATPIIATLPFTECGCDTISGITPPAVIDDNTDTSCCCCCQCEKVADLDVDEVNDLIDLYCDKGALPNDSDYVLVVNGAIKKYFDEIGDDDNDSA